MSTPRRPHTLQVIGLLAMLAASACEARRPQTVSPGPPRGAVDTGERAWRETSVAVALHRYSFWDGDRTFDARRAWLTGEELAILEGLTIWRGPKLLLPTDTTTYELSITDADGSVARFPTDVPQGAGTEPAEELNVDFEPLQPLLAPCLSGLDTTRAALVAGGDAGAGSDAGVSALVSRALHVSTAGVGCVHTVYSPFGACGDVWLQLDVAQPGVYRISLEHCEAPLELRLYAPERASELAAASSTRGACPSLVQTFEAANTYPLRLNASAADCPVSSGEVLLRVSPED